MWDDSRGVTPVIAAAILVALVAVLATGVWLAATSFDVKETAPRADLEFSTDGRMLTMEHTGGDSFDICRTELVLSDGDKHDVPNRYALRDYANGNGWPEGATMNGDPLTSCRDFKAGDVVRVPVYWFPSEIHVVYSPESQWKGDGESYMIAGDSFNVHVTGFCSPHSEYGVNGEGVGNTCYPGPDSTPYELNWSIAADGQGAFQPPHYYLVANSGDGVYRVDAENGGVYGHASIPGLTADTVPGYHGTYLTVFDDSANTIYVLQSEDVSDGVQFTDNQAVTQATGVWQNDVIYGQTGNRIVRRNLSDQSLEWQTTLAESIDTTYPAVYTTHNTGFITTDSTLYAFDIRDGTVQWQQSIGSHPGHGVSHPAYDKVAVVAEGDLKVFNHHSGTPLWQTNTPVDEIGTASMYGDSIIVSRDDGSLAAYNGSDGSVEWTRTNLNGDLSSPVVARHRVYIWAESGANSKIYAFEATDGDHIWTRSGLQSTGTPPHQLTMHYHGEYIYVEGKAYRDPTPPEFIEDT